MEMMVQTGSVEFWRGAEGFVNTPNIHEDWVQLTLPVQGSCEFIQDGSARAAGGGIGRAFPACSRIRLHLRRGRHRNLFRPGDSDRRKPLHAKTRRLHEGRLRRPNHD
ncbi:hypothetical protein ACLBWT_10975 [Paenibacillus sp. D51F]